MTPEPKLRVLQCPVGQAGQPLAFARALRKLGHEADVVNVTPHKFGYEADYVLGGPGSEIERNLGFLRGAIDRYDVFHFHARPFLWPDVTLMTFPAAWDIPLLKAAGKRVVYHFRGQEARTAEAFRRVNPYHYVDEGAGQLFQRFPDEQKRLFVEFVSSIADVVLANDPEIRSYVPSATVVPRAIDLDEWTMVGPVSDEEPLIVHAPSRRGVKGTDAVRAAVARMQRDGLRFRFRLVEGLSNAEARQILEQADIVVDQLRIGWYGVLAVEAMALGKPVVVYIRSDLVNELPSELPVANATPETIEPVLRELVGDAVKRKELGSRGREYCERIHDSVKVAEKLVPLYMGDPRPMTGEDWSAVERFIAYQLEAAGRRLPALIRRAFSVWREGGTRLLAEKARERRARRRPPD